MTQESESNKPNVDILKVQADELSVKLFAIEDEIASVGSEIDFSKAVRLGFRYLVTDIANSRLHDQIDKIEGTPPQEERISDKESADNTELIVESARRGNYSPAKSFLLRLALFNRDLGSFCYANGDTEQGDYYQRLTYGYVYVSNALPVSGLPFNEFMLQE